ncbi:MAG: hypothetical protein IT430_09405 [Phycisphaerales bacterium]|nr:hypothetical protein [Phycisphaerales bacterium]
MAQLPTHSRQPHYLLAVALPLVLLAAHLWYFYPFIADDAFISLRYAQRLVNGYGLTWNDGEYVEGYSNLLWVLLAAILHRAGMDLVDAVRLLGIACTLGTYAVLCCYLRSLRMPPAEACFVLCCFAVNATVAVWALGGLEAPLVMLLLTGAVFAVRGSVSGRPGAGLSVAALLLGLLCWTRPEGPIYVLSLGAGMLAYSNSPLRDRVRDVVTVSAVPFLFFVAQLSFRLVYYNAWVANSAAAKVAPSLAHMELGILYTCRAMLSVLPIVAYCYLGRTAVAAGKFSDPLDRTAILMIQVVVACVILAGGDIFRDGFRFYVPIFPLLLFLAARVAAARAAVTPKSQHPVFLSVVAATIAIQFSMVEFRDPRGTDLSFVTNVVAIGKALKARCGDARPLIAVTAAGAIPFYSELPALDVLGLNDAYLTQHRFDPGKSFGQGMLGHELFDPAYVKRRRPDILVFDLPNVQPTCHPGSCDDLLKDYVSDVLVIPGHRVPIYVRRDSTKACGTP